MRWAFGTGALVLLLVVPGGRATAQAVDGKDTAGREAGRLVERLERHPPKRSTAAGRVAGLFVLEVATGKVTLVADEPDPGVTYCGSPVWSSDGKRIIFDAMGDKVELSRLKVIEVKDDRPVITDLGRGNCPTLSPDNRRIAFLDNIGPPAGVWLMRADGSERKSLGYFGRPRWSPGGGQMMMTSFSTPCEVTIMDADPRKSGPLQIPDPAIHSVPSWADEKTLLAVIGDNDTIALIDTSDPADGKIKDALWRKGKGLDVTPAYPSYSPATGEYVFVGEGRGGMALYAFRKGQPGPPRTLETGGLNRMLRDPTFSPDGRFLLFTSDRPAPRPAEAGRGDAPTDGKASRKESRKGS